MLRGSITVGPSIRISACDSTRTRSIGRTNLCSSRSIPHSRSRAFRGIFRTPGDPRYRPLPGALARQRTSLFRIWKSWPKCCSLPPALPAGVYHFGAAEFGLRQLRAGDFRQAVVAATGNDDAMAHAPVIVICTGVYWRNAWKYKSRTYRHLGWDNGTILANFLAISAAMQLPSRIVSGFVDSQVNALLDLDTKREVSFSLASLGHSESTASPSPAIEPLGLPVVPDYASMRRMHDSSSLDSAGEVAAWRGKTPANQMAPAKEATMALLPQHDSRL